MLITFLDNHKIQLSQVFPQQEEVFSKHFSVRDPKAIYSRSAVRGGGGWDGVWRKYNKNNQTLRRPFLSELIDLCKEHNFPYEIIDNREKSKFPRPSVGSFDKSLIDGIELRDNQMDALNAVTMTGNFEKDIISEIGMMDHTTGSGKCLGRGTKVLMFDCSVKEVQDIKIGDLLMGDDSKPRTVKSICNGIDELFKVKQKNGDDYIVNKSHILSLKYTNISNYNKTKFEKKSKTIIDINITDYITSSEYKKHCLKGYKVGIDFINKPITIDPYLLGLWLGDGRTGKNHKGGKYGGGVQISTNLNDSEIINFLCEYSKKLGLIISRYKNPSKICDQFAIVKYKGIKCQPNDSSENCLKKEFKKLNLFGYKHIPDIYKYNSRNIRLNVLAGLIDSDGDMRNKVAHIVIKNDNLAKDVVFLARSLGFKVSYNIVSKGCTTSDYVGKYASITISGHTSIIPTKLKRKIAGERKQKKDPLVCGIKVESIGVGEYFGFEIDGNKRFMLSDFTVTHNTEEMAGIIKLFRCPTVIVTEQVVVLDQIMKRIILRNVVHNNDVGLFTSGFTPDNNLVIIGSVQAMQTPKKPLWSEFNVRLNTIESDFKKIILSNYDKAVKLIGKDNAECWYRSIIVDKYKDKFLKDKEIFKNYVSWEKDDQWDDFDFIGIILDHSALIKMMKDEEIELFKTCNNKIGKSEFIECVKKAIQIFHPLMKAKYFEIAIKGYHSRFAKSELIQKLVNKCELLMVDEADRGSSKYYEPLFNRWFNGRYIYGFSGTPYDRSKPVENLIIRERFGSILSTANRKEMTEAGSIQPIKYYMIQHGKEDPLDKTAFDVAEKREMIENNEFHQKLIKVVNSFSKEKFLILVDTAAVEEFGKILENKIAGSVFISGTTTKSKRNNMLKDFEEGKLRILIGSKILKRGLDLSGGADNVIILGAGKLESNLNQIIGRAVRLTKRGWSRVFGFYLTGNSYLLTHSRRQLKFIVGLNEYPTTIIYGNKQVSGEKFLSKRYRIKLC